MAETAPQEAGIINRNVAVVAGLGIAGLRLAEHVVPNLAKGVEHGLAGVFVGHLLTSSYLHRSRAHGAVTYVPAVENSMRVLTHVAALGVDQEGFVKTHRYHHEHSDTDEDPHAPSVHGFGRVLFGYSRLVGTFKESGKEPEEWDKWKRPKDALDRYYLNHRVLGWATGIGVHALIAKRRRLSVHGLAVGVGVHAVGWLHETGRLTAYTHRSGRPQNLPPTMPLTHLMSGGESHHLYHHEDPGNARVGRDGRFDPAWYLIRGLSRLGLCTIQKQ
ncbi:hypothetical protein E6P97_03820 [Patescibacteria group bacterium]|nr:MAG: hypothetical protein E6P97_03820 [Patescibacteria group bacterium]